MPCELITFVKKSWIGEDEERRVEGGGEREGEREREKEREREREREMIAVNPKAGF